MGPDSDNLPTSAPASLSGQVIVLAFQQTTIPSATDTFFSLFDRFDTSNIMLLEKTARLTSVSDWHDLMLVGLDSTKLIVRQWLHIFRHEYSHCVANTLLYSNISKHYDCTFSDTSTIILQQTEKHSRFWNRGLQ